MNSARTATVAHIRCHGILSCGVVKLTEEQLEAQRALPNQPWTCTNCGSRAEYLGRAIEFEGAGEIPFVPESTPIVAPITRYPPSPPEPETSGPYFVTTDDQEGECIHCDSKCQMFTIARLVPDGGGGLGLEEEAIGQSWGHRETVNDICDFMNMAFAAGVESATQVGEVMETKIGETTELGEVPDESASRSETGSAGHASLPNPFLRNSLRGVGAEGTRERGAHSESVRELFAAIVDQLNRACGGASREHSIAVTALEDASMKVNRAIWRTGR